MMQSTQRPRPGVPLDLPFDVWRCLVLAVLGTQRDRDLDLSSDRRRRYRDLARLAWTCRDAYTHIRPHLWSTLNLVVRNIDPAKCKYPNPRIARHLMAQHNEILDTCVFPSYAVRPATSNGRRLADRIRKCRMDFPFLVPLLVLDGKLYLASLIDNERFKPAKFTGIETLWGRKVHTRVVAGLALVEYPLHLVTRLTIDLLDSSVHMDKMDVLAKLPFLMRLGTPESPLASLHLLASYPNAAVAAIHHALARRYTGLADFEYGVKGGHRPRVLELPAHARSMAMHSDHAYDGGEAVAAALHLTQFSLTGAGMFSLGGWAKAPGGKMASSTLTCLTLDFDTDTSKIPSKHVPKSYTFPSLTQLTLTLPLARLLFAHLRPTMFQQRWLPPAQQAFPLLTRLTLLDTHLDPNYDSTASDDDVTTDMPKVPFNHMPKLAALAVPANHRRCPNATSVDAYYLSKVFASCTQLVELSIPGVRALTENSVAPDDRANVGIRSMYIRASHLAVLSGWFAFPDLVALKLVVDTNLRTVADALCTAPKLAEVVLQMPASAADPAVWQVLADHAPSVQRIVVRNGIGANALWLVDAVQTVALGELDEDDDGFEPAMGPPLELDLDEDEADEVVGGLALDVAGVALDDAYYQPPDEDEDDDDGDGAYLAAYSTARTAVLARLTSLTVTHPSVLVDHLDLPSLTHLNIKCNRLDPVLALLPQLAHLVIHGRPRFAIMWEHLLALVPPACTVELIHIKPTHAAHRMYKRPNKRVPAVPHLKLRYAGEMHGRIWRKVCKWDPLDDGAVGKSVTVSVVAEVKEREARMVARVLAHIMARQTKRVALRVVWRGEEGVKGWRDGVEKVKRAVLERKDVGAWLGKVESEVHGQGGWDGDDGTIGQGHHVSVGV